MLPSCCDYRTAIGGSISSRRSRGDTLLKTICLLLITKRVAQVFDDDCKSTRMWKRKSVSASAPRESRGNQLACFTIYSTPKSTYWQQNSAFASTLVRNNEAYSYRSVSKFRILTQSHININSTFRTIFNTRSQETVDVVLEMFGCLQAERTIAIRKRKFLNKFTYIGLIHNALCMVFVAIAMTELESCCTDV